MMVSMGGRDVVGDRPGNSSNANIQLFDMIDIVSIALRLQPTDQRMTF